LNATAAWPRVNITRAHLEEDVGKNFHFERNSGVDFNRAGVPLLEIVSEPEITGAAMAYDYLNALVEILVYGGISDCDMEKGDGAVRCQRQRPPRGSKELGKKIEIKNMNSFSGVRRALEYEIPRQMEVLQKGGQLTRKPAAGTTRRPHRNHAQQGNGARLPLFPEPDLMPFEPTPPGWKEVEKRVVELPLAKKQRLMRQYQLPASDAQTFVWDRPAGRLFREIAPACKNPKAAANWIINNLRAKLAAKPNHAGRFEIQAGIYS
jgi:aspartyl-tRNA(Asn)/glutamyl-tRNA(Gln) amidotransferase subunit B